jgi:hypothetical protein
MMIGGGLLVSALAMAVPNPRQLTVHPSVNEVRRTHERLDGSGGW